MPHLISSPSASIKSRHSLEYGWQDYMLYLAPASTSGVNLCKHSTTECRAGCLFTAGMAAGYRSINAARLAKARLFFTDRPDFVRKLTFDLTMLDRKRARGIAVCFRPNGVTDLPWERMRLFDGATMMERWPLLQFYDYTKYPDRFELPSNYHLTFSLAEDNDDAARNALAHGRNVAVVFDAKPGKPLPAEFMGHPVIDGDLHDLRFLDPSPVIVGLRAKGKLRNTTPGGFVRSATTQEAT